MIATTNTVRHAQDGWRWTSLVIGIVALLACAPGGFVSPASFLRAYLIAWTFLWGLALGSLALVMIHHLTGGAWGVLLRRALEAQMQTLPLIALLFVPIALGRKYLFPWSEESLAQVRERPFYTAYFQPHFVWGRGIVFFMAWIVLAWLLGTWSRQEERRGGASPAWKSQNLSGPGLVIYGLTLHFATIDWMMSLAVDFTSTISGPIVAAGQILSAFALAFVMTQVAAARLEDQQAFSRYLMRDLSNLLFTFVVVWAYLVWCQFMLIWMGDLPRDNVWIRMRESAGWTWMTIALVLFHFAVPFFLLLFRAFKQSRRAVAVIAVLMLAMQGAFIHYEIGPTWSAHSLTGRWMEALMPVGLGGIWLSCVLWLLDSRSFLPVHDRNWPEVERLQRLDQSEATREEVVAHG
jgi:hypothetical protein